MEVQIAINLAPMLYFMLRNKNFNRYKPHNT